MPVIAWVIVALVVAGLGTAIVAPAVVGGDDDPPAATATELPEERPEPTAIETRITDPIDGDRDAWDPSDWSDETERTDDATYSDDWGDEPNDDPDDWGDDPVDAPAPGGSGGAAGNLPF
jgi:hypothetical protein